jgi:hypothetical protein
MRSYIIRYFPLTISGLNGPVYSALKLNETSCRSTCAADDKCDAFAMPDGWGADDCHLLKQPLVQWDDGQRKSDCRCAIKQISSLETPSSECACYRFSRVAVGKQRNSFGPVRKTPRCL